MQKRPIMIVGAMEEKELSILKKQLDIKQKIVEKNCTFYETEINNYPAILCVSGIGTISTSVAMTLAICKYNPIAIINEGIAGAHSRKLHNRDIVVAEEVINIGTIKTKPRKEKEGVNILDWEIITFCDGEDVLKIEKTDKNLLACAEKVAQEYENVTYGRIASADIWNNEIDRILYLNEKYQTLCEDMESSAIYKIANMYEIPVISIKAISDNIITEEDYDVSVSDISQNFAKKVAEEYIKNYL